jgi:hypothetical protein
MWRVAELPETHWMTNSGARQNYPGLNRSYQVDVKSHPRCFQVAIAKFEATK